MYWFTTKPKPQPQPQDSKAHMRKSLMYMHLGRNELRSIINAYYAQCGHYTVSGTHCTIDEVQFMKVICTWDLVLFVLKRTSILWICLYYTWCTHHITGWAGPNPGIPSWPVEDPSHTPIWRKWSGRRTHRQYDLWIQGWYLWIRESWNITQWKWIHHRYGRL